ncbi:hypothetical protein, partial [Bifidobacterium animalis]|uniref:hypothetical protein n=1 Tax=Bifidobacterium animalis TaxID=28025 RepID=UPI003F904D7A
VFKLLWDNVAGFREFWQGVWDGLVNVVATAWTWIKNIVVGTWDAIVGWFQSGWVQAVWQTLVDGAQAAWNIITAVWGGLVDFFGGIFSGLATAFSAVWDVIGTAFMWVWESVLSPIYTWIADTWGRIAEIIAPVWDTITEKVAAFGSWFMDFWNTTLWPIVSQVVDFFKRIGEAVGGFISDHWPVLQKVLMIIGGVLLTPIIIGLGLVVGAIVAVVTIVGVVIGAITGLIYVLVQLPGWISQAVTAIKDWFGQAWQWTKDKFAAMGDAVSGWWRDHVAPLPGRVGQAIGGVIDWFKGLPGRIRGALSDAGSWLIDTGKNIVQGLINGMTSLAGKIGSYFLDKIPGWIRKPFESALGIHSPSRVFAGYGENIGQGLINGVQSMAGSVKGAAQSLANSAADVSLPEVAAPTVAAPVVPAPVPGIAVDSVAQMPGDGAALGAMMQQQQESMLAWGATAQQQTGEVVNPALASVGTTAQTMNDTQFQPVMLGMQTAMSATGSAVLAMTSTAWTPAMLGMQAASNATGANTSWNAYGVVNPALFSIANTAWNVLNTGVNPAMAGIRGALTYTANTFGWAAGNIAQQWNQVREATARPVRFAIQSVFNDGIVGMWNSASELLGTQKMAPYPVRFATGGLVRGPGGPKDDKIPALLSNHEYVLNAKAVRNIGVDNLNALNSGSYRVAPQVLRDPEKRRAMLRDKTFTNVAARYQGGGLAEGTPAWKALLRGYNWARSRNGRPYVWGGSAHGDGGTDCSGFMSGIADVILGGSGARQWATGNFPGSQQGAWKPGLAAGFAVGISDVHTAGTIGGAPGIPAVNVESGGINSRVKFGTSDAAGANDSQFNRRFSLIVTDSGAFVPGMGGGASMVDIIGGLTKPFQERMSSAAAGWAQSHAGIINTYPQKLSETLGKITRDKITKLSEEMMGDPGGVGAERWRPMAKRAMARVGFNWQDKRQVDAMIAQIQSESGGIPNRAQEIVDVNGTGASAGLGLLQIIPTTFAAHRDPELPNDRTNPFANMVAALRYYKSRYGMDLTTMWGHGHGYDRGGLITDRGLFSKQTTQAERVLSPRQTGAFEELVGFLGSADWQSLRDAGATITGDSGGRSVRTVEVTLNYYGSGDGEDVADAVEQRLIRSAW